MLSRKHVLQLRSLFRLEACRRQYRRREACWSWRWSGDYVSGADRRRLINVSLTTGVPGDVLLEVSWPVRRMIHIVQHACPGECDRSTTNCGDYAACVPGLLKLSCYVGRIIFESRASTDHDDAGIGRYECLSLRHGKTRDRRDRSAVWRNKADVSPVEGAACPGQRSNLPIGVAFCQNDCDRLHWLPP